MTAAGDRTPGPARDPARAPRRRWLVVALAALAALAVAAVLLLQRPGDEGPEELPPVAGEYPFGDGSVWRQDVRDAPLHEDSAAMVEHLVGQVEAHYGGVAAFNVSNYSTAFYTVDADQPRVDVAFDDCQGKGYTPDGLRGPDGQFANVPVPDDAVPARGADGQLTVWSPETDQLWEFWRAERVDGEWRACWGGRIDDVSTNPGFFSGGFGSSASGLAISGGMVRLDDVRAGRIEHTLALQVVEPKEWDEFSWPAQRSDGFSTDEHALPEGQRLRLDPDLDLDALDLHPVARMVAEAAQRYGFLVVDKAGSVAVSAETGQVTDGEVNPWDELLDGTPHYEVMAGFPWGELQVLPTDYGKP
ncbi:DUF4124 domain-containing protein [Kineococcus sp. SYSU DK004]|uniref:DUF4124 domain-containing protein n=1 Tax=Kineococcus sp. SYSU DK004 TaxID=3383125 RepID=UPI003D7E09A9